MDGKVGLICCVCCLGFGSNRVFDVAGQTDRSDSGVTLKDLEPDTAYVISVLAVSIGVVRRLNTLC